MSANDIEDTGTPLPRIANLRAASPLTLIVTWAEGSRAGCVDRIDLAPVINTYKIFRPLRKNQALFETAHLIEDGDVVAWNGADLELSAEAIEGLAEQIMTPQDFVAFMKRNNLTQEACAAILGYSRRQIGYYTTTGPIPRVVALACKGYEVTNFEKKAQQSRVVLFPTSSNQSPSNLFLLGWDLHKTGFPRLAGYQQIAASSPNNTAIAPTSSLKLEPSDARR